MVSFHLVYFASMEAKQFTLQIDEAQLASVVRAAVREELQAATSNTFNKKEAARYLKISPVTLWKHQRDGWIKAVMVGNRELFTKSELDRFASGQAITQ
jgi:excisionase family DNA binding protein